ncbi:ABC exporter membrane fusion protein [Cylindrospermopsis raciborskii]|uniref:ABC exporter membrane fusion protein n=1 Tax=Cylindrospermopsis raciborskii TaxID=77022 RepID=UPI000778E8A8|nr:ABC exporter membrane fusion protein [Cylindrospermopsis raciborskii]MCZ2200819.1 ABC exporter membrane fusion protein [Cylindrospermopsis raciborskii PAMP2012]MCZ2204657.1 ABC exporter membrane fusion protein [Cylindrospermopsis raciborskii PAMP2011]
MVTSKQNQLLIHAAKKWKIIIAASLAIAAGLASFSSFSQLKLKPNFPINSSQVKTQKAPKVKFYVTALGRLQPQGEITYLSAPNSINGVRVEKLLVEEGKEVQAGETLAYLENYERSKAAVKQAFNKLLIVKSRLAQVKAGAKVGDVNSQKAVVTRLYSQLEGEVTTQTATINRIQAEVENATKESNRYQKLYQDGAISAAILDTKVLQLKTSQQKLMEAKATLQSSKNTLENQIQEAKARLDSIKEVRNVDIALAQSEVESAETAIQQAKADHDLTYIKSPIDGRILKIHAKNGEIIGTSGFAELGKTSPMNVIAEVYQTDIQKVRIGQKAVITSGAFSDKIRATVKEIGWQVDKQSIFSINPSSDTDRRIVHVRLVIDSPDDSQKVYRLTNLQVDVAIEI